MAQSYTQMTDEDWNDILVEVSREEPFFARMESLEVKENGEGIFTVSGAYYVVEQATQTWLKLVELCGGEEVPNSISDLPPEAYDFVRQQITESFEFQLKNDGEDNWDFA